MKNFGNKKTGPSSGETVTSIDETIKQENLRLALVRIDNGNGTVNDRKLIRDASKAGVDLDSIRNRRVSESSQQPRSDGTGRNVGRRNRAQDHTIVNEMNRGNFPFQGKAIPFQVLSRTTTRAEEVVSPANSVVVEDQVRADGVQSAEGSYSFIDSMGELAGVWREMRDGNESLVRKEEGNMFIVPISSQDLHDDTRVHEEKLSTGERGVSLHFGRPKWRPLIKSEEPQGEPHIIDRWNAEAIAAGECVFQAFKRSEVIEGTGVDVQPGLSEILPPDAFVYEPDKFDIRETQSRQPSHRRWVQHDISRRTELRIQKRERSQIARENEMIASTRRPERR